MGTHFLTEQDDQTVPTPDASHHWMFMIAGLHLYIAPKRSSGAIAVMIISIHSSYNTERPGPKNRQGIAGGGNPNVGLHNPLLTGTQNPHRERIRIECKAYRSSDYDVLDAGILMFHRIFPPSIAVDIRWIIYQPLGLIWGVRFVVGDLRLELHQLIFFRVGLVTGDPTNFWDESRCVRVLSTGTICLIYRPVRINRVVNLKCVLLKKNKTEKKKKVPSQRLSSNSVKRHHATSREQAG